MDETKKTIYLVVAAVGLAGLALVSVPRISTPDAFADRGEPFFPDFTDPNTALTLEVVEFDEETAAARPFKVTNQDGVWTIPSHYEYPADGADRLAETAAAVIGITRDDFRSDNVADHQALGVLDPVDDTETSLVGRGTRVTLRGDNEVALADFIIGNEPEDRTGFRFVRLPDQKRVYAARMDIDLSTQFADWIEADLLLIERDEIDRIVLHDYSINERTYTIAERDIVTVSKTDGTWLGDRRMPNNREIDESKVNGLLSAIDGLSIVGVRPKPPGLSVGLTQLDAVAGLARADVLSLQSRGYYLTRDGGLRSNEGDLEVRSSEGILYTLRFGEVLYGTGEAISAGAAETADASSGPGENRYLFITAEFEADRFSEPPLPSNMEFEGKEENNLTDADRTNKARHEVHTTWQSDMARRAGRIAELDARFAPWYYVISSESFDKVHLTRTDLTKDKAN